MNKQQFLSISIGIIVGLLFANYFLFSPLYILAETIIISILLFFLTIIFLKNKLSIVLALFLINLVSGTAGYFLLGEGDATIVDSLYMTIISLSTVGYGEIIYNKNIEIIRLFSIYIIVVGMGNLIIVLSSLTNYLIEGKIKQILERRKQMSKIQMLKNHIIVCGGGSTSEHIVKEFIKTKRKFLLIEKEKERCNWFEKQFKDCLVINGDATEDDVLIEAGISVASVLVAILPMDKDNLFLTISTHHLNKDCRVVSKTLNIQNKNKLLRAGASSVVPNRYISALRIVSEVVSPNVVTFLDEMMRKGDHRIVEVPLTKTSRYCGKTIEEFKKLSSIDENLISIKVGSTFNYNPKKTDVLESGMILYFIMDPKNRDITTEIINK